MNNLIHEVDLGGGSKLYAETSTEYVVQQIGNPGERVKEDMYFVVKRSWSNTSGTASAPPEQVGSFTFRELSPDIVASLDSYLYESFRSTFSEQFQELKAGVARKLHYAKMIATVNCTNLSEVISAYKAKWKMVQTFRSKFSDHDLFLFVKDL